MTLPPLLRLPGWERGALSRSARICQHWTPGRGSVHPAKVGWGPTENGLRCGARVASTAFAGSLKPASPSLIGSARNTSTPLGFAHTAVSTPWGRRSRESWQPGTGAPALPSPASFPPSRKGPGPRRTERPKEGAASGCVELGQPGPRAVPADAQSSRAGAARRRAAASCCSAGEAADSRGRCTRRPEVRRAAEGQGCAQP